MVDWFVGMAKGWKENPWPFFCVLLVGAVIWLSRRADKRERENSKQLADLSREYGATMVRLEHVLGGLTQMRTEYKRLLAEYGPAPKNPAKAPRDG